MGKVEKFSVSGNIVDVVKKEIYEGTIYFEDGKITSVAPGKYKNSNFDSSSGFQFPASSFQYILPGLIDAHIHIESSMVIPSEFARVAVTHGTVATVSDPHEIANVLGIDGVKYFLNNGKKTNFKFYFGAPSCVPATTFETSGAVLGLKETDELLGMKEIKYLSEMMNYPGVINKDKEVMAKIWLAKQHNKPIDGHAPGLRGEELKKYIEAGISTDHECFSIEEAEEKIRLGMMILIREGSAAKNFDELIPLIAKYPDSIMLCSDDRHPDDLVQGHINLLVKRAIKKGYDFINIIRSCTFNPVKHYKLDVGLLQTGDSADFIIVDDLINFNVISTFINGVKVAENGETLIKSIKEEIPNIFNCKKISVKDIEISAPNSELRTPNYIKVIGAIEGQLITNKLICKPKVRDNKIVSDTENDILKIVVHNRYTIQQSSPVIGFIKGFGFQHGAIASSIAHDSHNIIAVGVEDEEIVNAINLIIENNGGISYSATSNQHPASGILPLPVGGIMSASDIYQVAEEFKSLKLDVRQLDMRQTSNNLTSDNLTSNNLISNNLNSKFIVDCFMTLSFMALLVIPELKISDKGLFDSNSNTFNFTNLPL